MVRLGFLPNKIKPTLNHRYANIIKKLFSASFDFLFIPTFDPSYDPSYSFSYEIILLAFFLIHPQFYGQFRYMHYPANTLSFGNESFISKNEDRQLANPPPNQRYGMSSSHTRKLCNSQKN